LDFLKSWKSSIIAALAIAIGVVGKLFPEYAPLFNDLSVFLIAVLAFFTKDADQTGTVSKPRL
jgi:hypothetical protein